MPRASTLALRLAAACLGLAGTACGGAASTSSPTAPPPTATPAPTATASVTLRPSPSASPAPPVQQVAVVATGLGSYLETTVPLAIVHNLDTSEAATGVVVHLRVIGAGGAQVAAADPDVGAIAPGATVIVPARVAGALRGDSVTATVDVAMWAAPGPPAHTLAAVAAAPVCASCAGGGSGSVAVTVTGDTAGITLFVGAACRNAGGAIVGGGSATRAGGPSGTPIAVVVPVILSAPAARCDDVSAAPGGF